MPWGGSKKFTNDLGLLYLHFSGVTAMLKSYSREMRKLFEFYINSNQRCGLNKITAVPIREIVTPSKSHLSGLTPSMSHNQTRDIRM
jgi:hypothetical protein